MNTVTVFRDLAYGTQILLYRTLNCENKIKFDQSSDQ